MSNKNVIPIKRLKSLKLEPGDILVIEIEEGITLSAEKVETLERTIEHYLPDNKVLLLDKCQLKAILKSDTCLATP